MKGKLKGKQKQSVDKLDHFSLLSQILIQLQWLRQKLRKWLLSSNNYLLTINKGLITKENSEKFPIIFSTPENLLFRK